MSKREEGVVVETEASYAYLKAIRHSSCKSCGACPGDNATIIKAYNKAKATEGDLVYFQMNEGAMIKATFIVFVLPLTLAFAGSYGLPHIVSSLTQTGFQTLLSVLGGILGLAMGIVFIRKADKHFGGYASNLPVVSSIKGKVL